MLQTHAIPWATRIRPWVDTGDCWAVRSDPLENVKAAFDANGISSPFPQRDVHLHGADAA